MGKNSAAIEGNPTRAQEVAEKLWISGEIESRRPQGLASVDFIGFIGMTEVAPRYKARVDQQVPRPAEPSLRYLFWAEWALQAG